jgi:hypothetical protein
VRRVRVRDIAYLCQICKMTHRVVEGAVGAMTEEFDEITPHHREHDLESFPGPFRNEHVGHVQLTTAA